jgi:uncharacterized protein YbjT (DUF2867 family)
MTDKILVTGANGTVGRPLVQALLARGERVKAASRGGAWPADVAADSAAARLLEPVAFDHLNPATWGPALEGVNRVFLMLPSGHVQAQAVLLPLVQALAERGVKIVFMSVLGVDADDSIPYRQVELAIERSGTPFVTLRPNWFADNFHTFWGAGVAQGLMQLPAGQGASSFIDARDIAEAAAAALVRTDVNGCAFNLTGPEALSYTQAAEVLSRVLQRPVRYEAVSDDVFVAQMQQAGLPADYAQFLAGIFFPVRQGWTAVVSDGVQQLTGRAPRSLLQHVMWRRAGSGSAEPAEPMTHAGHRP